MILCRASSPGVSLLSPSAFEIDGHGASWRSPGLRATSRQESDRLKAVRQVPPDDRRSELHPARTFATAAVREQGSISRLLRDDRQGNRLHLTDAGRTTAVYGQFVHRRSGGEAVKAI